MKTMTAAMAAQVCGGRLMGCVDGNFSLGRAIIDSRAVQQGDLFVAYKGENTDGHRYINKAFENGAACALAEYLPEDVTGPVILCDSVQTALEQIASAYRQSLDIPVVGISGSVGKTTAKEMVSAVLSQRFNLLKTDGNLNNQIGVPMTVSRIEAEHEAAVVEMGISGFGEMTLLADIARPTMAVFTVIGHAHLEFLQDLEGVFRAKTEMLEKMPEDAPIVFSGDDEMLRRLSSRPGAISCGLGENNMVRAENVELLPGGFTRCRIVYGERTVNAEIPAYGQHMVYAALEAAAVGFVMGLSDREIEQGIASYQTVGRRGVVTDTGFVTLVDDSYNANPDSV
ncbi:MAG: UDP-N-acetylmuramoyl-tripeptide--D-alanyl-D-alanine ligase, partial [Oscillospiraceae bacterium]|nr:UDP-N-acetylmuramoyl-tripeptide--D-alanyl-D-alanine ligase [Oscillospiraceae bacterium]